MGLFMRIEYLGLVISFFCFLIGIKFPDWDFKWKLRHRSIITHSPLFSTILVFLYYTKLEERLFSYVIASFSFGIAIHMIFDLFPHGWGSGALLKIPIFKMTCSPKNSQYFFLFTIILNFFYVLLFLERKEEYFIYILFGFLYMLSRIPYEKKFWRPFGLYFLLIALGALNFVDIALK